MTIENQRIGALWSLLANDTKLSQYVTDADRHLFKTRIGAEGISFVTVTLPALGKALDLSFKTGQFVLPEGWVTKLNCAYPAFLHKAWEKLFHPEGASRWFVTDGVHQDVPLLNEDRETQGFAVLCIRQLTMAFYKYEQPWTCSQEEQTYEAFKMAEEELWAVTSGIISQGTNSIFVDGTSLRTYLDRAEMLIERLLRGADPNQIDPQYGTGATADHASPWGRWQEPRFIPKLDREFPYDEWFFSGINGLESQLRDSKLDLLEVEEPGARVVLVPKDSRGPRLISAEPREFMYIQQGLFKAMSRCVESYPNVRAQVSIIDQTRNQRLARWGSETGSHATLDLKEASDRVSWWLVTRLFPENWVNAFDACRSEYTVLPSGEEIPLTKFAPMGSACCFPVEAIVFWALCNAARKDWSNARIKALFDQSVDVQRLLTGIAPSDMVSPRGDAVQDVCVFGDDIIVPVDHVDRTVALLESVGLKINQNKSYAAGPFRESCGGDFFVGVNVTPVRVKHLLRGDGIDVVFRACDVFNRISDVYGDSCPSLCVKLRDLFQEFFEFKPPLLPAKAGSGSSGLVLYDTHWRQSDEGQTLRKRPEGGYQVIKAKRGRIDVNSANKMAVGTHWETGEKFTYPPLRNRPYYNRCEIRVLTEVADEVTRNLGWSSVLRSFCVGSGRGGTDKYALRRRVHYKLAWIAV